MIHFCIVFYDMMEKIVFCQKGVSSMDERLRTLQAETEEEQTLRRKRDSLEVEYRSLCSYERELAVLRQKGQEDVARMEQGGVRNLFTKVTGKYGEALAQEQAEAAETETKYQKVQQEFAQMEDTLRQLDKRIGELSGSQARYDAYILQRAEELEGAGTDSGTKDLQARIRTLEEQARTLLEKRNRLADVRWEVRNVLGILEDAAGYGRWDAGRGSLLSSFLKQERVQKAKEAMIGLQEDVQRAKDVEDKQLSAAHDHLQEARRQRGWDIFLDNILIDWSVQDEIEMALARLHHFSGALEEKERVILGELQRIRAEQEILQKQWKDSVAQL